MYLFEMRIWNWIWIWAARNWGCSLFVSVVRDLEDAVTNLISGRFIIFLPQSQKKNDTRTLLSLYYLFAIHIAFSFTISQKCLQDFFAFVALIFCHKCKVMHIFDLILLKHSWFINFFFIRIQPCRNKIYQNNTFGKSPSWEM